MEWESWGFKETPFKTHPITKNSLKLFTGHKEKLNSCKNCINNK